MRIIMFLNNNDVLTSVTQMVPSFIVKTSGKVTLEPIFIHLYSSKSRIIECTCKHECYSIYIYILLNE